MYGLCTACALCLEPVGAKHVCMASGCLYCKYLMSAGSCTGCIFIVLRVYAVHTKSKKAVYVVIDWLSRRNAGLDVAIGTDAFCGSSRAGLCLEPFGG